MEGLRLLGVCVEAAQRISKREDTDVLVKRADGVLLIYIDGEEQEVPWLASPMPATAPGQPATMLDMSPTEIQLGRWHKDLERFIPSRTMSVEDFLQLAEMQGRTAKFGGR
jgi:hypothetical protein